MELHQLRYFLEVAKRGSFSRAAEACHVTQPSLSQQIKKLEEEFGDVLFHRTREGIRLTSLGEDFLLRAQRILGEVAATREAMKAHQEKVRGPLRVGAIPTIAPYLLPRVVNAVSKKYPRIDFTIHEEPTEF